MLKWFVLFLIVPIMAIGAEEPTDKNGEIANIHASMNEMGASAMLKGFADVTFKAEEDTAEHNSFALGQFNLFLSTKLSDKVSAVGETVFEFNDENTAVLDVERIEVNFSLSEYFNIKAGRMHSSLGFWNSEYHHGTWLHTAAFRPLLFNWEDENGIIPNHFVGFYLFGKEDFDILRLEYDLGVANGRGKIVDEVQNISDANEAKAYNLRLNLVPSFSRDLKLGTSFYYDQIPADPNVAARNGEITELIYGGHLIYTGTKVEFLFELLNLLHDDKVSNDKFNTLGLYVQGAYRFGEVTPYYRFDYVNFGNNDPFYSASGQDTQKHSMGIRWDVFDWTALKAEYSFQDRDGTASVHGGAIQVSFTF